MARHFKAVSAAATVALLAGAFVTGSVASAAQTAYRVQEGAHLEKRSRSPAEGMLFYAPRPLRVHQGDTITFNIKSFHTATLIDKNTPVGQWVADNATPGGNYALLEPDPDDPGSADGPALKFNDNAVLPSDPSCGTNDNPCGYNGSQVVNSGISGAGAKFTVTVNASPGDFFYVVCLVHLNMRLRIKVVPDGKVATTQAEIKAFKLAKTRAEANRAGTLHRKLLTEHRKHRTTGGKLVWDAYAGVDGHGFSLYDMYPRKVKIRRGQTVRWHFDALIYEDHTVTFPKRKALNVATKKFGAPKCDPDGDAGAGPDNPPDQPPPTFCSNSAGNLEFDFSPRSIYAFGGGVHKRHDFDSSGIRGSNAGSSASYDLRFTKRTGRKGQAYICLIHAFMVGRVAVSAR